MSRAPAAIPVSEYARLVSRSRSKYRATPAYVDGIRFASGKEAARYQELLLLLTAGEIHSLVRQPRFALYVPLPQWDEYHRWTVDQDAPPKTLRLCPGEYGPSCQARRIGRFTADFAYVRADGTAIIEDVKGGPATRTEAYKLRVRMVEAMYGVRIEEV